ncbi:PEP/pyruvate-binding domain-containing protein [Petrachloros mirabilis]
MAHRIILPLHRCHDPSLVGGKAIGLARLQGLVIPVPDGYCVTTEAYYQALRSVGFSPTLLWEKASRLAEGERRHFLIECQLKIRQIDITSVMNICVTELQRLDGWQESWWAVRSSATNEDTARASFAGMYRTELGVSFRGIGEAIKDVWASIWTEAVVEYMTRTAVASEPPAMAVILQPLLDAQISGVAYSIHPVTGRDNQVAVNAVRGLGMPVVDGSVTPDQYVVEFLSEEQTPCIRRRILVHQSEKVALESNGLQRKWLTPVEQQGSSLSDSQLLEVAQLAKRIERAVHGPIDLEWVIAAEKLWVLQARPITTVRPSTDPTDDDCEWSRANFKETMPEIPSPMGLSFLKRFMEVYILAHYRRLGCQVPEGLSSVRTLCGRPYINMTLFHSLVGQLRGEPTLNVEQMGGESLHFPPLVQPLGWLAFTRAGWLMWREMKRVEASGPGWFAEMKELADANSRERVAHLSVAQLNDRLERLGKWLDEREVTFGIAGGVGQCLQTFSLLLPGWLGEDWRNLLNAALQGQGTVISAQQIMRLAELVEVARGDAMVSQELRREGTSRGDYRRRLHGTRFLAMFDRYLEEYGHRGLGESDIMSPRFADQPEVLLEVIKVQLCGPVATPADIVERQRGIRETALAAIRARFGWRLERWLIFQWWYRRLCRFFSLRESNRHHLMFYSSAVRNLLLRVAERLVEQGVLATREDVFFLTMDERAELALGMPREWAVLVKRRRAEREGWVKVSVPDTIRDWAETVNEHRESVLPGSETVLRGVPISPGMVTGTVRLVRLPSEWNKVHPGDIIVAPVIDPGMAPLFGVAGGIIVEMGGTLSHGAIIAREYGLPAVANVHRVTYILSDGDRVTLDAGTGNVIRHIVVASDGKR